MPTAQQLRQAQNMLNVYRGSRVLAVTITFEEWMTQLRKRQNSCGNKGS